MKKNILFLEGEKPATYSAMRSLAGQQYYIVAASHLKTNIAKYSRYVDKCIVCPEIDSHRDDYKNWLIEEIKNGEYLTVFSFADKTTKMLSENREILSAYTFVYQPDFKSVDTILNKTKTYELARTLGMNLPEVYDITGKTVSEIAGMVSFPAILRPRQKNFIVNGKIKYYKVTSNNYFWDKNDFLKKIPKFADEIDKFDLMSYIDGVGRGYFTVVSDHKTFGNFAHERIREFPVSGGASSCRKSIPFEEIKTVSLPIIDALNWTGPIMIEYKFDIKNNKYYLIEVNGRWWGSLPLAINAGVPFPSILMDLVTGKNVSAGSFDNYPINFTSRLLIPHDILYFISCLLHGKFKLLPGFFRKTDSEDIFDWKDFRAYLIYIISLFTQSKFLKI